MQLVLVALGAGLGAWLTHYFDHRRWLRAERLQAWSDLLGLFPSIYNRIHRAQLDLEDKRRGMETRHTDEIMDGLYDAADVLAMVVARVRLLGPPEIAAIANRAPSPRADVAIDLEVAEQVVSTWAEEFTAAASRQLKSNHNGLIHWWPRR